jgi:hypothetical protein
MGIPNHPALRCLLYLEPSHTDKRGSDWRCSLG